MKLVKVLATLGLMVATMSFHSASYAAKSPVGIDIIEALESGKYGKYEILLGALRATDLYETLRQEGPFTIFAPTDEAFDTIPKSALADREKLKAILLNHVVAAPVTPENFSDRTMVTTLGGLRFKLGLAYVTVRGDIRPYTEVFLTAKEVRSTGKVVVVTSNGRIVPLAGVLLAD